MLFRSNPEIGLFLIPLEENEQCFIGQIYDQNSSPRFLGEPIPTQKIYTPYEFLNRFTFDERSAIRNIAKSDDIVADFLSLAQAANQIISDNSDSMLLLTFASFGILFS